MRKKSGFIMVVAALAFAIVLGAMAQQKSDDKAIDPVCGMTVSKAKAAATFDYKGTKYYFCSTGCKDAFAKDPDKYIKKEAAPKEPQDVVMAAPPMMGHGTPQGQAPGHMPLAHGGFAMMGQHMAMRHAWPMGMMGGPMRSGMDRLLLRRDVAWTYEKTADGVTIKISSKDPETVKTIQERLAMAKETKETMTAPAAACSCESACSCANGPMKEKVKK
jgi:Cu+-exporting ATPase